MKFMVEQKYCTEKSHWYISADKKLEVNISIWKSKDDYKYLSCMTYFTNKKGYCVESYNPYVIYASMLYRVAPWWKLDATDDNERLLLKSIAYMYDHKMCLFTEKKASEDFLAKMRNV